jgi:excisionase family DNA binding protein
MSEYTIETAGRLLRVEDVAHALSVAPHTIRRWMSEGRISFVKLGRCSRISEHELHRLLAQGFRLSKS